MIRVFAAGVLLLVGCAGTPAQQTTNNGIASLDLNFGSAGRVQTVFSQSSSFPNHSLILQDGRILSVGETQTPRAVGTHRGVFAVALYSSTGQLEPGFVGGTLESSVIYSKASYATSAVELCASNCEILVGGVAQVDGRSSDFALQKYTSSGLLNPDFGEKGQLLFDFDGSDVLGAMAVQPDGKIILAGYTQPQDAGSPAVGLVLRMNAYGELDPGFGQGGVVRISLPNSSVWLNQLQLSENRIFIAGTQINNDPKSPAVGQRSGAVWAYTLDGQPDLSFAKGFLRFDHGFYTSDNIALSPSGGLAVLALGRPNGPGASELHLYRFDLSGQLLSWRNLSSGSPILDANLAIAADGSVYVASSNFNPTITVEHYLPSGQPDAAFGRRGLEFAEFSYISRLDALNDGLMFTVAASGDNLSYSWNLAKMRYN